MRDSRYRLFAVSLSALVLALAFSAPALGVQRTVLGELFSGSG
jgi:hypothetical protein